MRSCASSTRRHHRPCRRSSAWRKASFMKIIARDRKGVEHNIEGNEGWTVMEALRDAGLPITAECGGACACATCHVYVEEGWFEKLNPPSPEELDMLDMALAVEP